MNASSAQPVARSSSGPLDAMLFKTKLCSFFQEGRCTRTDCRFGHSEAELRPTPDLTKTTMCRYITNQGYCHVRACTFAHSSGELRQADRASRGQPDLEQTRMAAHSERHMQTANLQPELARHTQDMDRPAPASNVVINRMASPPPVPQMQTADPQPQRVRRMDRPARARNVVKKLASPPPVPQMQEATLQPERVRRMDRPARASNVVNKVASPPLVPQMQTADPQPDCPAPASNVVVNKSASSTEVPQQAARHPAVQINFLACTMEDLVALFRAISPAQLILAQPTMYMD